MSTWNHRVVDMTTENGGESLFAIREVFYRNGRPASHGEPSMVSENMEGLEWLVNEMLFESVFIELLPTALNRLRRDTSDESLDSPIHLFTEGIAYGMVSTYSRLSI